MKIDELIDESLVYERAISHIEKFIADENKAYHIEKINAKEEGRKADPAYIVATTELSRAKLALVKKSAELIRQAESEAHTTAEPYANLLTAIEAKAVSDYELALCGFLPEYELKNIEEFASYGDLLPRILSELRIKYPRFEKLVKNHFEDIAADTRALKKRGAEIGKKAKYRCPFCGGGLYEWGRSYYGVRQIRCTGCDLKANER